VERLSDAPAAHGIHVLNGPNLDLLGTREPAIYGTDTLADIERACRDVCDRFDLPMRFSQTNCEGDLIGRIHAARDAAGIVINPAGCSYSVPVLDALKLCRTVIVEVHISNIHARAESWRADSLTAGAADGVICGLGSDGYRLAVALACARQRGESVRFARGAVADRPG